MTGPDERSVLDGRRVHSGQSLYLLTHLGWHPVRFVFGMQEGRALLYFSAPGAQEESKIPVESGMRLAWPDEVNMLA